MINMFFFLLVGLGMVFSLIRMVKGTTHFDRVVSLDVINVSIIGLLIAVSIITKNKLYLDVTLVYALLGFLETIVFAKFLEGRSWK